MNPKESEIQNSICDYLSLKRYLFWRQNTSPTIQNDKSGNWHFRRMPKYSMKGIPDIIIIKDGQFIGLEVKRPKGKQSEFQIEFQKRCEENGGKYFVVTSIDDVKSIGL